MTEICLELRDVKKSFVEGEEVLQGISLAIGRGEFITLLGASGCGKTTTLRIIAGLEIPDEGTVCLEGKDVTFLEPDERDVNTVFQNYALFPHMNVADNIGYGLKIKKGAEGGDKEESWRDAKAGTACRFRKEKAFRTVRRTEAESSHCKGIGE